MPSPQPYRWVARFYDQLHAEAAQMTRGAREKVLGKILPRVRSVCDLGCGTGTTALEFARRGMKVYAVDLSPMMCRLARQKARRARLPVRVIWADMRTFRLPEAVDLVTCEFNPVNHLPSRADLIRAARSVWRALRPGGHFYFDVNTRRSLEELYPGARWFERPKFCLVLHGSYDRRRERGRLDFEWFIRNGKSWQRRHEHIEDIWWTDRQIRAALRRVGFSGIRSWDGVEARPRSPRSQPGYDAYYLAQKPLR